MEVVPDFTSERSPVIMSSPRRAVGLMPDPERASDSEHSREPAPVPERASVPVRRLMRAPVPEVSPRRAHVTEFSPNFSPSYFFGGLIGSGRKGQGEGWGHEDRRRWSPKLPAMASWAPCAAMSPESPDPFWMPPPCLSWGASKVPTCLPGGGEYCQTCVLSCVVVFCLVLPLNLVLPRVCPYLVFLYPFSLISHTGVVSINLV